MKNSPCYKCTNHSTVCHAECVAYREWLDDYHAQTAAARITADADAHTKQTIERNCKRAQTKRRVGQK